MVDYCEEAKRLRQRHPGLAGLVRAYQHYLDEHFENLGRSYKPHSILESRFTPAQIAFEIGMRSCGALTNIGTEMLREVGFKVEKIHGFLPESPDHAWFQVWNPDSQAWEPYDLTRPNCQVTPEHRVVETCHDWVDIAEEITRAHLRNLERQKPKDFLRC